MGRATEKKRQRQREMKSLGSYMLQYCWDIMKKRDCISEQVPDYEKLCYKREPLKYLNINITGKLFTYEITLV